VSRAWQGHTATATITTNADRIILLLPLPPKGQQHRPIQHFMVQLERLRLALLVVGCFLTG